MELNGQQLTDAEANVMIEQVRVRIYIYIYIYIYICVCVCVCHKFLSVGMFQYVGVR